MYKKLIIVSFVCCFIFSSCQNGEGGAILEELIQDQTASGEIKVIYEDTLDEELITIIQREGNRLVEHGKVNSSYDTKYGWSCFVLVYNGDTTSEECYFKKNYHEVNNHTFRIYLEDGLVKMGLLFKEFEKPPHKFYSKWYFKDSVVYLNENREVYHIDVSNQNK